MTTDGSNKMSPEDRQAWLDMAGPDFLPWLQHEVEITLAWHGVGDGMANIKKQIEDLKATTESQSAAIDALVNTSKVLTGLQSQVVQLLADLSHVTLRRQEPASPSTEEPSHQYTLFEDVQGESQQTVEEVAAEDHKAPEPLHQKLVDVLDYLRENKRATQVELSYKLSISKTSVCERLGKLSLLGLVVVSPERTHSSGTALVYRLAEITTESDDKIYKPKPGTRAALIYEFVSNHPWLTASEILVGVPWVGKVPDRNVIHGTLHTEANRGHFIKFSRPGGFDCYALPGTPLPSVTDTEEASEPAPNMALLRPLTLHEQMTLNALKGQDYLNVAKICERITAASGATAQTNSIASVCARFFRSGRLDRKVDDAGYWSFRINP
jgi:DNA-binding Lrp family transcriptional regulator